MAAKFFDHAESNKCRMVKSGMDAMWRAARKTGTRQHACEMGVPMSCYPCASGAILWRANGFNYSRKSLESHLVRRAHYGDE